MLPHVFPSSPTATNANASKQVSSTQPWLAQRAQGAASRAAAMADEIDAGIRVEALVPVLRLRAGGCGWGLVGVGDWDWDFARHMRNLSYLRPNGQAALGTRRARRGGWGGL